MKYVYVLNRFNLKEKTDDFIRKLKKVSESFLRDYEILVNDTVEEAKDSLKRFRDQECIITPIGGDGSINLALNDLVGTKNILAFLPHGTGNDFNRFCHEEMTDGIHEVDIVRINDRYFINVACFGIDADIANDDNFIHNRFIPEAMRYNAGVVHYFLTYRPRKMKVEVNGEVIEEEMTTAVVANAHYYGGGYKVSPMGKIDDGKIEIIVADRLNKIRMAKVILSMKDASHLKDKAVHSYVSDKAVISSDRPFKANIDGEPLEASVFEMEVIPKGIRIDFDSAFIKAMLS